MNFTFNEPFIKALVALQQELVKHNPDTTYCAVMGGAIRDMLLNKPIKDIDIFVSGTLNTDWFADNCKLSGKDYGTLTNFMVFNWYTANSDLPVQIIVCKEPLWEVEQKFPCTLSMVHVDYLGAVNMTREFRYAADNELLIFTENCPEEYKERIHAKYPEFL